MEQAATARLPLSDFEYLRRVFEAVAMPDSERDRRILEWLKITEKTADGHS